MSWWHIGNLALAAAWLSAVLVRLVFPGTGAVPATLAWLGTVAVSASTGPWLDRLGEVWGNGPHSHMLVCGFVSWTRSSAPLVVPQRW